MTLCLKGGKNDRYSFDTIDDAIIGQVAWLLGELMDGIFNVLSSAFGIET